MNWFKQNITKEAIDWKTLRNMGIGVGLGTGALLTTPHIDKHFQEPQTVSQPAPNYQKTQNAPKEEIKPTTNPIKNVEPTTKPTEEKPKTPTTTQSSNYKEIVKQWLPIHEGKKNKAYLDTKGIPTIGIGFNLKRPDAKKLIGSMGLSYANVLNGTQALNEQQINYLFNITLNEAEQIAKNTVSSFSEQPEDIKAVLIDMSFNLGPSKLAGFKKFIQALNDKDYNKAADEMIDSDWYRQVKSRSKKLESIVRKYK